MFVGRSFDTLVKFTTFLNKGMAEEGLRLHSWSTAPGAIVALFVQDQPEGVEESAVEPMRCK